ncbi:hypothetical protein [Acinetobacter sp. YH16044]|uniref:hypothetical protein n=1 Tax=Acinetobacter sp. YH16044 TaxID=2601187 RepID=UPI0015D1A348|nr:hypothetical protein [Acinetobacter sp. YH16044]
MKQQNKKNLACIIISTLLLIACKEQPQQEIVQKAEKQATSEPVTQDTVVIPPTVQSTMLVNNPTPFPHGYEVDTTHLKQAKLIDFNGDGKLDAFRVLKNPSKSGKKYLFEFRIADSTNVYWYENEDPEYDLNGFEVFEKAENGEKFVDMSKLDTPDLMAYEDAPEKARFILKTDGITTGYPESCGTSLFYLDKDKIHRMYLD